MKKVLCAAGVMFLLSFAQSGFAAIGGAGAPVEVDSSVTECKLPAAQSSSIKVAIAEAKAADSSLQDTVETVLNDLKTLNKNSADLDVLRCVLGISLDSEVSLENLVYGATNADYPQEVVTRELILLGALPTELANLLGLSVAPGYAYTPAKEKGQGPPMAAFVNGMKGGNAPGTRKNVSPFSAATNNPGLGPLDNPGLGPLDNPGNGPG